MRKSTPKEKAPDFNWSVKSPYHPWTPYSPLGEHGAAAFIKAPQSITVIATPQGHPEIHEVTIEATLVDGRYRIGRFEVRALHGGVSAEAIRRIPTASLFREAVANSSQIVMGPEDRALYGEEPVAWWNPLTDAHVGVDVVYMLARAVGQPPTQAVAEHFGISQQTAAGRVRRRRALGMLPPTTPGKVT